jgi:single-strand DNA-binding protein
MYSKTTILGNVGKEPEMRYTADGKPVVSFSVAVDSGYGDNKTTAWYRVSAWNKLAEVCNQFVVKGMTVLVDGELRPDKQTGGPHVYEKNDGTLGASFEINANTVKFVKGGKPKADNDPQHEDELPF